MYSANAGTLFTMQRGWNSALPVGPVDNKNSSIGVNGEEKMHSLGCDPVNISSLLMGAK